MNKFLVIAGLVGLFFLVRMTSDSGQWESFVEDNGDRYLIDMSSVGPLSRESTIVGEKDVARAMMQGPGHAKFDIELWCDTPLFKNYESRAPGFEPYQNAVILSYHRKHSRLR